MQESPASIPHWMQLALTALASILSTVGIDKLYNAWLNRKKPAAEINVTEATAAEITILASSSASDAIMRMMDRLSAAQLEIDRLRKERDSWQDAYDKAFTERDEVLRKNSLLESEIRSYDDQIKRMHATLTLKDQNYDNTK